MSKSWVRQVDGWGALVVLLQAGDHHQAVGVELFQVHHAPLVHACNTGGQPPTHNSVVTTPALAAAEGGPITPTRTTGVSR